MNIYQKTAVILFSFFVSNFSMAGTLTSGNSGIISNPTIETGISAIAGGTDVIGGNTVITLSDYSVFVEGNLFLDYSFFTESQVLNLNGSITAGGALNIFSYDQTPIMPDLSITTVFLNPDLIMNEIGDVLIYSDIPIANSIIEATNNIYIGNYATVRPVPLPASFFLFFSGLVALFCKSTLTRKF